MAIARSLRIYSVTFRQRPWAGSNVRMFNGIARRSTSPSMRSGTATASTAGRPAVRRMESRCSPAGRAQGRPPALRVAPPGPPRSARLRPEIARERGLRLDPSDGAPSSTAHRPLPGPAPLVPDARQPVRATSASPTAPRGARRLERLGQRVRRLVIADRAGQLGPLPRPRAGRHDLADGRRSTGSCWTAGRASASSGPLERRRCCAARAVPSER